MFSLQACLNRRECLSLPLRSAVLSIFPRQFRLNNPDCMTDLGIWYKKLDNIYEFEQFYLLFET